MFLLFYITLVIGCSFVKPSVEYNDRASQWRDFNSFRSGDYTSVPVDSTQTSEGYHLDPDLLENVKHIILKDELHNAPHGHTDNYGAIVGIELIDIQQSIEVAQYHQGDHITEDYARHDNPEVSHLHPHGPPSETYITKSSSYDVPIEPSYEVEQSSTSESDLSHNNAPVFSTPSAGLDDYHNSYTGPATVYGSSFPSPSSHGSFYEEPHSINIRNVRRTPFSSTPYRHKFYKFRH